MSAFIVSDKHIDALVRAALAYPNERLRWFESSEREESDYQRGQPWGQTAVANAQTRVREITPENASHVGRILLLENMRSVAHRYDETLALPEYDYSVVTAPCLTPVEVLKAISWSSYLQLVRTWQKVIRTRTTPAGRSSGTPLLGIPTWCTRKKFLAPGKSC